MQTGLIVITVLALELSLIQFLLVYRERAEWMRMLASREGLVAPEEKTAADLVARHIQHRRDRNRMTMPLPGTEWMKKAAEK